MQDNVGNIATRVDDTHDTIVEVERNEKKLYENTYQEFRKVANELAAVKCEPFDQSMTLANYIIINRLQQKMYTDLAGAVESVFSSKLSPILLPPDNLYGLLYANSNFFIHYCILGRTRIALPICNCIFQYN